MAEGTQLRLSLVGEAQPDSHVFGAEGGVFGRSRKCDWMLVDEERILSSVHGQVLFENGTFVLVDESTNGIFLDEASDPIGRGNAVRLSDGMRFSAGPYSLEARVLSASTAQSARHPLHGAVAPPPHSGAGQNYRRAEGAEHALGNGAGQDPLWGRSSQDPLDYLDTPSPRNDDPLGIPQPIAGPSELAPPAMPATARQPLPAGGQSGGDGRASRPAVSPGATSAHIPDDFLAGLGAATRSVGETQAAPPASPSSTMPIPADFDPLTALNGAAPADAGPRPLSPGLMADLVDIDSSIKPAPPATEAAGEPISEELKALRSRRAARRATLRQNQSPGVSPPIPPLLPAGAGPAAASPAAAPMARTGVAPSARVAPRETEGTADPVRALVAAMGFPEVDIADNDRERLLREIGETVRESAAGLIALLAARRAVKSEFRMDETQVQPEENNPFKFFDVAELALDELFLTRKGGFQPPGEAARSAFEDVQQHTLLTMSAMQRAIRIVLDRLSPETIANGNADEGALKIRGLGGGRKDKWTAYGECHARMSANIDTISRQVIGEAFAQVNEEQARKTAKAYWGKEQ